MPEAEKKKVPFDGAQGDAQINLSTHLD